MNAGKLEYLTVAAQEISASVAQLYVSSRVKADRDSEKLIQLGQASKKVNEATAAVLAAVRDGKQTLEEKGKGILRSDILRFGERIFLLMLWL